MYEAKNNGRNQVIVWHRQEGEKRPGLARAAKELIFSLEIEDILFKFTD